MKSQECMFIINDWKDTKNSRTPRDKCKRLCPNAVVTCQPEGCDYFEEHKND